MFDIQSFLTTCQSLQVLVVGDLMLDRYLWGKVERISPEAPVPVVDIFREENRLGGAGNVALNLHALGISPVLCGWIGQDMDGEKFLSIAHKYGFKTNLIEETTTRRTTVKTRVIGNHQQVLRIDREDKTYLQSSDTANILEKLKPFIPECHGIIFQDYNKGFLSRGLIEGVIQLANTHQIPVMVDPKFHHFFNFKGVKLFKPNLKELSEAMGERLDREDTLGIAEAVLSLKDRMPHQNTLVTLSENGMLLIDENSQVHHIPTFVRDLVDVSGAGDTVIAVASAGIAAGLEVLEAANVANLAAGLVCEEVGVVPINQSKLVAAWERRL
ncbi:MAG: D-glycero-beta-D-manno-heptose-7-phosphate kinase [Bacteroidetes bacterium]|nr:D-glycero-beta-D-manno-heptose-7-phosphate kinase [Bacteroidota bacterium]MCB0844987.1 D-glycero-beta-D-manno-heptose-7-phosphate kinase [Bacteroidota bacterium]